MVAAAFLNFVFRNTLQLCLVSIYIRVKVGSQTCPQLTSGSFGSRCQTLSFFEGLFLPWKVETTCRQAGSRRSAARRGARTTTTPRRGSLSGRSRLSQVRTFDALAYLAACNASWRGMYLHQRVLKRLCKLPTSCASTRNRAAQRPGVRYVRAYGATAALP